MQQLVEQEVEMISGGNDGWSAFDMGYVTGQVIGGTISAVTQGSYSFGVWLYDATH